MHVSANVVWSDDFSDGNYNGWTILEGSFLTPSSPRYFMNGSNEGLNMIYHPSTQLVGSWLFEIYEDGIAENSMHVLFIATGLTLEEFEGYSLYLEYGSNNYGVTLCRWNYSSYFERSAVFLLISYYIYDGEMDLPEPAWHTYNITRTGDGTFYISRDSELIITSTPAVQEDEFNGVINSCDKFIVKTNGEASIDTIIVGTDLSPITPFETTTTETTTTGPTGTTTSSGLLQYLPIIGIAGAGVVIVIIVIFALKRR